MLHRSIRSPLTGKASHSLRANAFKDHAGGSFL
jgi:hypothetical protein